jgi:hypothetical protein
MQRCSQEMLLYFSRDLATWLLSDHLKGKIQMAIAHSNFNGLGSDFVCKLLHILARCWILLFQLFLHFEEVKFR